MGTISTLYGPGGSFGTTNSELHTHNGNFSGFSTNNTQLIISDSSNYCFNGLDQGSNISCGFLDGAGFAGFGSTLYATDNTKGVTGGWRNTSNVEIIATASSSPTAVPFGVSTDLSLLILGGLYGASRLRRKLAK